jgi:hypothetical protein
MEEVRGRVDGEAKEACLGLGKAPDDHYREKCLPPSLKKFQAADRYQSRNTFMQKALPPDFSNSDVSIKTGVRPSRARTWLRLGVTCGVI